MASPIVVGAAGDEGFGVCGMGVTVRGERGHSWPLWCAITRPEQAGQARRPWAGQTAERHPSLQAARQVAWRQPPVQRSQVERPSPAAARQVAQ